MNTHKSSKSYQKPSNNHKVLIEYVPKNPSTNQADPMSIEPEETKSTMKHPNQGSIAKASNQIFYQLNTKSELISKSLNPVIEGKADLKEVVEIIKGFIKKFDPQGSSDVSVLEEFLRRLNKEEKELWEKVIFPQIARLILKTSEIFPSGEEIRILDQRCLEKVSLTKQQCACLAAHMFMCTTSSQKNSKLPGIFNFAVIFAQDNYDKNIKIEKLKCMGHYFKRTSKGLPNRSVVFQRLVHQDSTYGKITLKGWLECPIELGNLKVSPEGTIEGDIGAIEIDFANRLLGGATLKNAMAQEQIQFMTSPELLVGILFCEVMGDKEAILMRGTEIYSKYKGYAHSYKFDGDYEDTRRVVDGVLDRDIVAIDAINFNWEKKYRQFSEEAILREINKAYVGFLSEGKRSEKAIATGKWGCGIFWGDVQLKLLIQWIAASRAGRDMRFYSFGEDKDLKDVEKIVEDYKERRIGELVEDLVKACKVIDKTPGKQKPSVFSLLRNARV